MSDIRLQERAAQGRETHLFENSSSKKPHTNTERIYHKYALMVDLTSTRQIGQLVAAVAQGEHSM